jgi:exodeoxyribonuclease VII small subunit
MMAGMNGEVVDEPIAKLSYEDALAELETLIRKLETGSVDLADSIASYERGVALAAHCSSLLEDTEKKVQRLVLGPRGEPSEVPMDVEDEA